MVSSPVKVRPGRRALISLTTRLMLVPAIVFFVVPAGLIRIALVVGLVACVILRGRLIRLVYQADSLVIVNRFATYHLRRDQITEIGNNGIGLEIGPQAVSIALPKGSFPLGKLRGRLLLDATTTTDVDWLKSEIDRLQKWKGDVSKQRDEISSSYEPNEVVAQWKARLTKFRSPYFGTLVLTQDRLIFVGDGASAKRGHSSWACRRSDVRQIEVTDRMFTYLDLRFKRRLRFVVDGEDQVFYVANVGAVHKQLQSELFAE